MCCCCICSLRRTPDKLEMSLYPTVGKNSSRGQPWFCPSLTRRTSASHLTTAMNLHTFNYEIEKILSKSTMMMKKLPSTLQMVKQCSTHKQTQLSLFLTDKGTVCICLSNFSLQRWKVGQIITLDYDTGSWSFIYYIHIKNTTSLYFSV